jgi:hypothetical protein
MKTRKKTKVNGRADGKIGHDLISDEIIHRPLHEIRPSPENDQLYGPVDRNDPDFRAFAEKVLLNGITDPLLITLDGCIISGHRRYAAAEDAGMNTAPCRTVDIYRDDPRFLKLLRVCNAQRMKSLDQVLREQVVDANPDEAYQALLEHRRKRASVSTDEIELGDAKRRARITEAKRPLLDAIVRILKEYRDSWPLSVRQVHYYLLNDPPLIHASKPGSRYHNDLPSYKAADELITRARLTGEISHEAIRDPTRPVASWAIHRGTGQFVRAELDGFMKGYWRDLMQSQPNHIEIIGEKNTIEGALRRVAMDYTIPYTIGRGYSSFPPRQGMASRFRRSGKEQLILLVLTDFDQEGKDIGRSFAQSMRDDFGIDRIRPVKVTLTAEQVQALHLPPNLTAKKTSSRRRKFVERHGENVFELEAIPPTTLQRYLRAAIDSVLDIKAFNAEIDQEKRDAAFLADVRRKARAMLGELGTS